MRHFIPRAPRWWDWVVVLDRDLVMSYDGARSRSHLGCAEGFPEDGRRWDGETDDTKVCLGVGMGCYSVPE